MGQCLITRKGGSSKVTEKTLQALGFVNVPKGEWVLKTGSLAQTSLDGVNYIPLTAYTEFKWLPYLPNNGVNVEDNLGTVYFQQYADARDGNVTDTRYGQITFKIDVDLASKYNKDCSKLLQITSVKGTPGGWGSNVSQTIKTWIEKVS